MGMRHTQEQPPTDLFEVSAARTRASQSAVCLVSKLPTNNKYSTVQYGTVLPQLRYCNKTSRYSGAGVIAAPLHLPIVTECIYLFDRVARTLDRAIQAIINACSMSAGSEKEEDDRLGKAPSPQLQLQPQPDHRDNNAAAMSGETNGDSQHDSEHGNGHDGSSEDKDDKAGGQDNHGTDEDEENEDNDGNDDGDDDEDEDEADDNGDDEEDDDDDDGEDEEPKLKYAKLTGSLASVYRNGDATSSSLIAGDKMVCFMSHR